MPTIMITLLCFTASLLATIPILKNQKATKTQKRLATISIVCVTFASIAMFIAAILKII